MVNSDESWKDIPGFEGFYQVSNLGKVRSVERIVSGDSRVKVRTLKGRILRPYLRGDRTKYLTVNLSVEGLKTKLPIHQTVLEVFHGPRPTADHVARHLNDIATDIRSDNLAWGTQSQNMKDKFQNGYVHPRLVLSEEARLAIKNDKRSQRAIARDHGVSQKTVFRVKHS